MYLVIGLLILTLFCSCGARGYFDTPSTKTIYQIIKKNNRSLAAIGIYEVSNGGGGHPLINLISEGYITNHYRFTSIEAARPFICKIIEEFTTPLNKEMSLRPLFQDFPITAENIRIIIRFVDDQGIPLDPPYISRIRVDQGKIVYFEDDKNDQWKSIHSEPYEEAKKICLQNGSLKL